MLSAQDSSNQRANKTWALKKHKQGSYSAGSQAEWELQLIKHYACKEDVLQLQGQQEKRAQDDQNIEFEIFSSHIQQAGLATDQM